MRIDYQIWANGELTGTHSDYLSRPPEIGSQIKLDEGPLVYDVVAVSIDTDYNDDEGTAEQHAYVHLRLHLPDLTDILKPVGHDGPCHPVKLNQPSDRDALAAQVVRRVLTLDVEQLQRTLMFISSHGPLARPPEPYKPGEWVAVAAEIVDPGGVDPEGEYWVRLPADDSSVSGFVLPTDILGTLSAPADVEKRRTL